ncbi:iron-sulfur cluster assembly accessory protein [Geitlerinema sp. PCC 9228]|jgi:iron-sulfur cluster assembly accessory protein|uniref:HesB/IscA family protein n=1 Tax=Geitlerinema sp. PCC 9228 TaxID=111611 RepID=UPI0008F98E4E|nr:iron-sulfur cluster assembly accessory protein [Geitlerinema sp. PCC 9228]
MSSCTIHIRPAAAREIQRLLGQRQNPHLRFRLGVQTGGCADLYYTLQLDETVHPNDCLLECGDLPVTIKDEDRRYLEGTVVDYSEDLMGGGFRFHNPNATHSCSCGISFSAEAGESSPTKD